MQKRKTQALPLISCLCVTEGRPEKLERAIRCFFDQTYPNKEMVVVYKPTDADTIRCLKQYGDKLNCVAITEEREITLGERRNISINHSKGEFICNWDDDDWYHPQRLEYQYDSIATYKVGASMLAYYLIFDATNVQGYMSYFRLWESTIMVSKATIRDIRYPALNKNEDYDFTKQVIMNARVYPLICPELYIYVYHGKNTWNEEHFKGIFAQSKKLSRKTSLLMQDILESTVPEKKAIEALRSSNVRVEFDYFFDYRNRLKKQAQ